MILESVIVHAFLALSRKEIDNYFFLIFVSVWVLAHVAFVVHGFQLRRAAKDKIFKNDSAEFIDPALSSKDIKVTYYDKTGDHPDDNDDD